MEAKGVEPSTSALRTQSLPAVSKNGARLTSIWKPSCTTGCTSERESANAGADDARTADPLAILTAAALELPKGDRLRLLAVLAASLGVDEI